MRQGNYRILYEIVNHELIVSVVSIRNWEQGKRYPTGAARALYRILDKQPEAALAALERRTSLPKPRRLTPA